MRRLVPGPCLWNGSQVTLEWCSRIRSLHRRLSKHGLGEEDILHAYRNPIRVWDLGDGFTMMLGPNAAAIILEVGYVEGDTAVVIIHAMRARKRFLQ